MSNSVAPESNRGHDTRGKGGKRGEGNEEKENEERIIDLPPAVTSTTVSTAPAPVDRFMLTPKFKGQFVEFVPVDALIALKLATKGWNAAANALIDGEIIVQTSYSPSLHPPVPPQLCLPRRESK